MYALLMMCKNVGWTVGNLLGAGIMVVMHITSTDFHNLVSFIIIGGVCKLFILPLIPFLIPRGTG